MLIEQTIIFEFRGPGPLIIHVQLLQIFLWQNKNFQVNSTSDLKFTT